MMDEKLVVTSIDLIGWASSNMMNFGIVYTGEYLMEHQEKMNLLKFTALTEGKLNQGGKKTIEKGFTFLTSPSSVREIIVKE